jgi:hypothetical protein
MAARPPGGVTWALVLAIVIWLAAVTVILVLLSR